MFASGRPWAGWELGRVQNEAQVCALLSCVLSGDAGRAALLADLGWPEISHFAQEFPLGNGRRADFALFHLDGSVTVIEVKDGREPLARIWAGIGQLSMYAVLMARSGVAVRRCLAVSAMASIEDELTMEMACEIASVQFLPLGDPDKAVAAVNEVLAAHGA